MKHHACLLLTILATACATEVTVIEERASCLEGPLQADGTIVKTGDPCYDAWASAALSAWPAFEAAATLVVPSCLALSEAAGVDTAASESASSLAQAAEACQPLGELALPSGVQCTLEIAEPALCGPITMECTAEPGVTPPPWLDAYVEALPEAFGFCCAIDEIVAAHPELHHPACAHATGTETCAQALIEELAFAELADAATAICGGAARALAASAP